MIQNKLTSGRTISSLYLPVQTLVLPVFATTIFKLGLENLETADGYEKVWDVLLDAGTEDKPVDPDSRPVVCYCLCIIVSALKEYDWYSACLLYTSRCV